MTICIFYKLKVSDISNAKILEQKNNFLNLFEKGNEATFKANDSNLTYNFVANAGLYFNSSGLSCRDLTIKRLKENTVIPKCVKFGRADGFSILHCL